MTVADREAALVARYTIIPDLQERLMAAMGHRGDTAELRETDRSDTLLVPGCQSRVWLRVRAPENRVVIHLAADSPLVRGLAALVCDVYALLDPGEAAVSSANIVVALGFDRLITPTRLNGLASVQATLRQRAHVLAA